MARNQSQAALRRLQRRCSTSAKIHVPALIELHIAAAGGLGDLQNLVGAHIVTTEQSVTAFGFSQRSPWATLLPLREDTQSLCLGLLGCLSRIGRALLNQFTG